MSFVRQEPRLRLPLVGLVVAVLVLVLVLVAALANRERSAEPVPRADPTYTETRTIVSDTYERPLAKGWGAADIGGEYSFAADESDFRLGNGVGLVRLPRPGAVRMAELKSVRIPDLTVSVDVIAPATVQRGSGVYVAVHLRTNGAYYYRALLRFDVDQKVYLSLSRLDGSVVEPLVLANDKVVATKVRAGDRLPLTFSTAGDTPVRLRASVEQESGRAVGVEATDSTASRLVGGGPLALWTYVARKSDADKVVGFDNLNVRQLQVMPPPESATGADGAGSIEKAPAVPAEPAPAPDNANPASAPQAQAGSQPVGSTRYPVPGDAVFVARNGSRSASGTRDDPYRSIQQAVQQVDSSSTVVVRGGSYHESVVLPAGKVVTLQSYPGEQVWLDGSSPVTEWSPSGSVWESSWNHDFDSSPTYTRGAPDRTEPGWSFRNPSFPMAAHPDQVWVDGQAQSQVQRRVDVTAGTFYVDTDRQRLVLGTDPTKSSVRASTLAKGLTVLGQGDTVRGIGVRRYATSVWQMGAATVNTRNVRLENVVLADNATTGLSVFASDVTLSGVTAVRNGLMGVHANVADRLTAENVLSAQNNLEHFNRTPSAGGMKVTSSRQVRVTGSEFAGNDGHGLWFDDNSYDVQIAGSRAVDNTGAGVVLEISSRVSVVNNVLMDNGVNGLWVINTDRVEVANNTLARNADANLRMVTDGRHPERPGPGGHEPRRIDGQTLSWVTRDVSVYNNVLSDGGARCVVCVRDVRDRDPRITLDRNYYFQPEVDQQMPFAVWRLGRGNSAAYADFRRYQEGTDQDRASVAAIGGPPAVGGGGELSEAVRTITGQVAGELSPAAAKAAAGRPAQAQLGAWRT